MEATLEMGGWRGKKRAANKGLARQYVADLSDAARGGPGMGGYYGLQIHAQQLY